MRQQQSLHESNEAHASFVDRTVVLHLQQQADKVVADLLRVRESQSHRFKGNRKQETGGSRHSTQGGQLSRVCQLSSARSIALPARKPTCQLACLPACQKGEAPTTVAENCHYLTKRAEKLSQQQQLRYCRWFKWTHCLTAHAAQLIRIRLGAWHMARGRFQLVTPSDVICLPASGHVIPSA